MSAGLRRFEELVRSFRWSLVVFAGVAVSVWAEHDALAAWLMRVVAPPYVTRVSNAPGEPWLAIALRLGLLAAAVPLAGEGWRFACRRLGSPERARWWPLLSITTALALAGSTALALRLSQRNYLVCLGQIAGY